MVSKAWQDLGSSSFQTSFPTILPLAYSISATLASFLFAEHTKLVSVSRPLVRFLSYLYPAGPSSHSAVLSSSITSSEVFPNALAMPWAFLFSITTHPGIHLHVWLRGNRQSGNNSPAHWVQLSGHKVGIEYLVSGWVKSSFTQGESRKQFCATVSGYTPVPAPKGKVQNVHGKPTTL